MIGFVLILGCRDQKKEPAPSAADQAKAEIMAGLILPPDSQLMESKVRRYSLDADRGVLNKTMLFFHFTSQEDLETISQYYLSEVKRRGLALISDSEHMIVYSDRSGHTIYVSWSEPKEPEYDYKSVIHIGVEPVPPELMGEQAGP